VASLPEARIKAVDVASVEDALAGYRTITENSARFAGMLVNANSSSPVVPASGRMSGTWGPLMETRDQSPGSLIDQPTAPGSLA